MRVVTPQLRSYTSTLVEGGEGIQRQTLRQRDCALVLVVNLQEVLELIPLPQPFGCSADRAVHFL
jgi:hypothetical protein